MFRSTVIRFYFIRCCTLELVSVLDSQASSAKLVCFLPVARHPPRLFVKKIIHQDYAIAKFIRRNLLLILYVLLLTAAHLTVKKFGMVVTCRVEMLCK